LEKYVRFPRRPITFPCAGDLAINIGDGALRYRPDIEFELSFSNSMDEFNSSVVLMDRETASIQAPDLASAANAFSGVSASASEPSARAAQAGETLRPMMHSPASVSDNSRGRPLMLRLSKSRPALLWIRNAASRSRYRVQAGTHCSTQPSAPPCAR